MKKHIFALFLLLITFNCFAQNDVWTSDYKKSEFGIKGGLNLATEYNGKHESGTRAAGHVGILAEFFCGPKLGFQPELIFSMQGGKFKDEDGTKYTEMINYINMPFVLKIYMDTNRKLSLDTGVQPGYMVACKFKEEGYTAQDVYSNIDNKFDVSLLLGLSYRFGVLELGMRYNLGLLNPVNGLGTKNSVMQLSAAIRL